MTAWYLPALPGSVTIRTVRRLPGSAMPYANVWEPRGVCTQFSGFVTAEEYVGSRPGRR